MGNNSVSIQKSKFIYFGKLCVLLSTYQLVSQKDEHKPCFVDKNTTVLDKILNTSKR